MFQLGLALRPNRRINARDPGQAKGERLEIETGAANDDGNCAFGMTMLKLDRCIFQPMAGRIDRLQ